MSLVTHLFRKWTLPPERDFGWRMKPLGSARTTLTVGERGVYRLIIEHDKLKGVTPRMLHWWFRNIGGDMVYQGRTYPRYLVWHPMDHIHWSLEKRSADGSISAGSYFHVVEAFDRNMEFLIDNTLKVEQLDQGGIRLSKRIGRLEVFSLHHTFDQDGSDTIYRSTMVIGSERAVGSILNPWIKPLFIDEEMMKAWFKHNVEEVGNFELFLPELYANETKAGD